MNTIISMQQHPADQNHPLSSVQEEILFDQALHGVSTLIGSLNHRVGTIDLPRLKQAIQLYVNQNDALRTVLTEKDGVVTQTVLPAIEVDLQVIDIDPFMDKTAIDSMIRQHFATAMPLYNHPLWDVTLWRMENSSFYFLQRFHHVIADGWSGELFYNNVNSLYNRLAEAPAAIMDAAPSYLEVLKEQQRYFASDRYARDLAFWIERCQYLPPSIVDPQRDHAFSLKDKSQSVLWEVKRDYLAQITQFAAQHKCSIVHFMLTLIAGYFHRSGYTEGMMIGMPVHNRATSRHKQVFGPMFSIIPIRIEVDPDLPFAVLMQRTAQEVNRCYRHRGVPISNIAKAINLRTDEGRKRLYDVTLRIDDWVEDVPLEGTTLEGGARVAVGTANTPIEFFIVDVHASDEIELRIDYDPQLFTAQQIEEIQKRFSLLMNAVLEQPDAPFHALPLLTEKEQTQLLIEWNQSQTDFPLDQTYAALFARQVAAYPERIAAVCQGIELTYRELDERATRIAHSLIAAGARTDMLVTLMGERDLPLLVMMIAVLKAGAAFLSLDVHHPIERLRDVLQSSKSLLLLTSQSAQAVSVEISSGSHTPIRILVVEELWQQGPVPVLPATGSPDDLAYAIFTSGSTGKPKGVLIEQRGMLNNMLGKIPVVGLGETDRVAQTASPAFDISVWQFLAPPLTGGTVHILPDAIARDPLNLLDAVESAQLTLLEIVPSLMRSILDLCPPDCTLASLRWLMPTGEALPLKVAQDWLARFPQVPLMNVYGPAECSDDVLFHAITSRPDDNSIIPVGRPTPNNQIYILDKYLQPIPVGIAGEICVAGVGVSRGYLDNTQQTLAVFIDHPFAPGERFYRTGDLGRYRADGVIEYLGRLDHQVKIRGFRIELGEIEAAMAALPEVHEAIVMAREDVPGDTRLVGYMVLVNGVAEQDASVLRANLSRSLPDYMVPAYFVFLEQFPLTPNGKINRKALPAPDMTRNEIGYVAPRNAMEETLAGIWADVLSLDKVGIHDNFFNLGGHSLLVTQLVSRIRNVFQIELPLRSLFEVPTVAALAHLINHQYGEISDIPAIVATNYNGPLPLSFAQQRLWFLDQFEPNGTYYNIPAAFRLHGQLDHVALERSLQEIVRRHAVLRTTFATINGNPLQVVAPRLELRISQRDLRALPSGEREAQMQWVVQDDAQTPFDLNTGPLLRAGLIRLTDTEHVILFTIHHIVADGWSMGVLIQEIATLYAAYVQSQPSPLPELAIQYTDFAQWQRQWLQGCVLEKQLNYWKKQLAGAPALLTLPTDRPRPAIQTHCGATHSFIVNPDITAKLHALSRQAEATLFMTLAAAFNLLLSRHAGQDDICIGTPIANRNRSETENLIGFFVNTLVLRTHIDIQKPFTNLLQQVRQNALEAYAHQDVPFEQLVEALNPARQSSHSPLFQVMLVLQNAPTGKLELPGLTLRPVVTDNAIARFDLTLNVTEENEQLLCGFEYNTDLFDASTIERMAGHFTRLLDAIITTPKSRLADLPMLGEAERHQLLIDWNQSQADFPPAQTYIALFTQQVAAQPERIAVVCDGTVLRYDELNNRVNRFAHYLIQVGVVPAQLVGLYVERSIDMLIALLGILKAGATYVPLDPRYPKERLSYILEDANFSVIVTQSSLSDKLETTATLVELDVLRETIAQCSPLNPDENGRTLTNHDVAYVIYTSGSTGKPNGVQVTHSNLVNFLYSMQQLLNLREADRLLAVTSMSFDIAGLELFLPLMTGASIAIAASEDSSNAGRLATLLVDQPITVMQATPSTWKMLLDNDWKAVRPLLMLCGGEAWDLSLAKRLLPHARQLWNVYGPTETTIWSAAAQIDDATNRMTLGRPLSNTQLYVLDARLQPVPIGVTGEIYIGGAGVAKGYLHRPALTEARFIANPFAEESGNRLYKTGDLGRYLLNGSIEYLGRNDFQVKIRGYRIETGEIEVQLRTLPSVREAVVIASEDTSGTNRLIAYLVVKKDCEISVPEIRSHLSKILVEYMIPSVYVVLETLPLTPNGKLDRKALPAPEGNSLEAQAYEAPTGEIEVAIAEIWQQLLNIKQIGRRDNFFTLGGHSLLAVQFVSRLRQALDIEVSLNQIFTHSTLQDLAHVIGMVMRTSATPLIPVDRTRYLPMSWSQQRLWFLHQLDSEASAAYHLPAALRLRGHLDESALRSALDRIVARHEILRSSFIEATDGGPPLQIIGPADSGFALTRHDLRHFSVDEQRAIVTQLGVEEVSKHFDLHAGPLIRGQLLQLADDDYTLFINQHHIIADAWSIGILINEISVLYIAFLQNAMDPLPPLPIQYVDYAVWQRQWLLEDKQKSQIRFWLEHLSGAPSLLELPLDHPRPAMQSYAGATISFELSTELTAGLKTLTQQHAITLFMALFAGWSTLMTRLSGQADVVIGTPVANRQRVEFESLLGMFVNTLALRVTFDDGLSVAELFCRVKAITLEAYANQDVPFEQVVDALQPVRSLSHSAIFQVLFSLNNTPLNQKLALPGLNVETMSLSQSKTPFDLFLSLSDSGGVITGELHYASDLFDTSTIQRFIGYYQTLLMAMVDGEIKAIHTLPLLGPAERYQLLNGWNDTARSYPDKRMFHQLFELQTQNKPDAIALVYGNQTVTYAKLNADANRLAHHLLSLGVECGQRIAICIERGFDMVIGLLGILKAGATYVPLDPHYPKERLSYILEDANFSVIVTQSSLSDKLETMATLVELDVLRETIAQCSPLNPDENRLTLANHDVAYVIYTSGSTGKPNGVQVTHGNLVNFLYSMQQLLNLREADRLLAVTSMSFDIAGLELFLPLMTGASIAIAASEDSSNAGRLATLLADQPITVMQATPSTWKMLLDNDWKAVRPLLMLCGGEAWDLSLAKRLLPHARQLWNVYGPTETTIWSAAAQIDDATNRMTLGRPLPNTQLYVLDARLQPVPIGVTGEIYIGGAGVAKGYLHRPALTEARFIANPFAEESGNRLYKTGDLGRYLSNGSIEYLGRNDFQVKIRGYRIETGEIEVQLRALPSVREAAVIAYQSALDDIALMAYVVPETNVATKSNDAIGFSLFFFGADASAKENKYALYCESAKFADTHGFEAIWTPERHFDPVGSLYPNPSVLSAALATLTTQIKLRAGSVVLPLHNPVRIVEEWSVVDNLSGGRVGLSVASGWHPRDFVLSPQNYQNRRQGMLDGIHTIRSLWQGEKIKLPDGAGNDIDIQVFPAPLQSELPLWITAAGNPETFIQAGRLGTHVLTHLLGQSIIDLAQHIQLYRKTLLAAGHDASRAKVTLMVHTYVGEDFDRTIEEAREPFLRYMRAHLNLMKLFVESQNIAVGDLSNEDMENIVSAAFSRYSKTASLIGTPETCMQVVNRLKDIGVDEIACLIDWMDADSVLQGLPYINQLRERTEIVQPSKKKLRQSLKEKIPDYMIPADFVFLKALPLTPNGKIDRKALPAPDRMNRETEYIAPSTEIENTLALIWSNLLAVEKVGVEDNFFELGGHSLLAIKMLAELRSQFHIELPIRLVFENPTITGLAQAMDNALHTILPSIQPVAHAGYAPASLVQKRLWFLDHLEGAQSAYHVPGALRLKGILDKVALTSALRQVIGRHESLRTTFAVVDNEPVQVISAGTDFELLEIDLSSVANPEVELLDRIREEMLATFDLAQGPLIRGKLLKLAEQEHVLLIMMHHIISDGGLSMGILVQEMSTLYQACIDASGKSIAETLPPLPIQYADYAIWQKTWLNGQVMERQLAYWKNHLSGAPILLEIPTDYARPPVRSFAGDSINISLSTGLIHELRDLAKQQNVTLFMLLLTGWAITLSRLSGQNEIVIGSPVAGRDRKETEGLIGFFANTLPLKVDITGDPSVKQLLNQTREMVLDAFSYQDVPFEQIVEVVQPPRSLSHNPIFQVMFAFYSVPEIQFSLPDLKLTPLPISPVTTQFDLTLMLEEVQDKISGRLEYAKDLFEASTVERIIGYWRVVMAEMVQNANGKVSRLSLLTLAQRTELLSGFNQTETDYPRNQLVHELFEIQAEKTPDRIAVIHRNRQLTYRELNEQANRVAHSLINKDVQPDNRIALCMERSVEMIVAVLGILKAGCAYVPLDPAYPAQRLADMLEDADPAVILVHGHLQERLPRMQQEVMILDRIGNEFEQFSSINPVKTGKNLLPSHLAYVIYTSGSSGKPKGVAMPHLALTNLLHWHDGLSAESENSRTAQFSALGFDVAFQEIFTTLCSGSELVLMDEGVRQDPHQLIRFLADNKIQKLFMPFIALATMAEAFVTAEYSLPLLRDIIVAGEQLRITPTLSEFFKRLRACRLHNHYGPTESHVVTALTLDADIDAWPLLPDIGHPIANARIYILDAERQPVPVGVAGEIYIGGTQLARGYLNLPELTMERFIADPFSKEPDDRLYKTGDLASWRSNGTIAYLGRNDFQVKVRGYRIEPGEIEVQLATCDGIREAVVLIREDTPGNKRLVAYLIPEDGHNVLIADLRSQLANVLAEYMIPTAYVLLKKFPLTPNGKLDRNALPMPEGEAHAKRAYEIPANDVEAKIAGIWQQLLGIEQISRKDHFFELGGHSLLAVQLVSRLRDVFKTEVSLRDIFSQPILHDLAQVIDSAEQRMVRPIEPVDRNQNIPLSWSQQRLYFLDQLDPAASIAYHLPVALRLKGQLDVKALRMALDRIVIRHEILRTTFNESADRPVQIIASIDSGFALTYHDLRNLPESEQHSTLIRLGEDEVSRRFDLMIGPLIRGQLLQFADDHYVLFVNQHHIVSDGWSRSVLVKEFVSLYGAFSINAADPLQPLPIQYADYAFWQRAWLQEAAQKVQIDFWRQYLDGAPALLELPLDRSRPAIQSYAGAVLSFELSAELTAGLKALAQRHDATLFMVLLSGWSILLARLSGQDDVVIGTSVANRNLPEIESLLGFFVNTLALRVPLAWDISVTKLLHKVKTLTLDAYANQDIPFEQVVDALQPARSLSHNPIFQVLLSLNNTPSDRNLVLPDLNISPVALPQTKTQFDLQLQLTEVDEVITADFSYATDLFDADSIERIVGYFLVVLKAMIADDSQPLCTLQLLSPAQRQQLLVEWNDTQMASDDERLVHQLFEAQASIQPEAIALTYGGQHLSYAELNAKANQVAHYLLALGIRPDDRVAIFVERSFDMVVSVLGILKAGGAYVPIDPGHPEELVAFMLNDSAPVAVLTQEAFEDNLPALSLLRVVVLDDATEQATLMQQSVSNPDLHAIGLKASHLAYVIYTSGSTGRPKGVMIEHQGLRHYLRWARENYLPNHLPEQTVTAIVSSPLAFDATVTSLYTPLLAGGTVTLLREGDELVELESFLRSQQSWDLIKITPAHLAILGQSLRADGAKCFVQNFVVGGEALPTSTVMLWREICPQAHLINEYGPTETVVGCSTYDAFAQHLSGEYLSIGRPITNTTMYILDSRLQPVPVGVIGEIHIGGAGVARGYLNRPDITEERFLSDPFSTVPNARMYKTGDLACYASDGTIRYLGRNDFQVKIRGYRIELGEIEAQLIMCRDVGEAVVVAREDSTGDKRLVAYLVAEDDAELSIKKIRRQLSAVLAEYMVPVAYVILDALPLTSNGKVNRNALLAPEDDAYAKQVYEAPVDEIETVIANLWQSLLHVAQVGRRDNFFELGGHSLLAVQLVSRLRQELNVELPLRQIFISPILQDLAQAIDKTARTIDKPIITISRTQDIPLSLPQQRLWFLDQLEPGTALYNIPAAVRFTGELDVAALTLTFNEIVQRHEALRTTFATVDGSPVQVITSSLELALPVTDMNDQGDLSSFGREARALQLMQEEAQTPFDLANGPLIRVRLLRLDAADHIVLLTVHHIVSDGWSMGLLVQEVAALYAAHVQNAPSPLPALPVQYADFAHWQRQWLSGDTLASQLGYWQEQLAGAPALLALPTDRPRPLVQSYRGATLSFVVPAATTTGLQELSQRTQSTLFMTLTAAFNVLLSRYSGQNDICIGTPIANRNRAETENLIGFFVNTLVLRTHVDHGASFADLLQQVRTTALGAYAHQDVPFEQLVEVLNPERHTDYSPLFQVMLVLQNAPTGKLELPGLTLQPVATQNAIAKFDLTVSIVEEDGCLLTAFEYNTDLFEEATITRMAGHFTRLLDAVAANAGINANIRVGDLVMLSEEERLQLVVDWNDTAVAYPRDLGIYQLFEAQVARTPDVVALVFEGNQLTYRELNIRANRLAHHLRSLGVGPDVLVGLCMERSVEMIVGLLGILKAGGAYVPFDPAYPQERLAYMLDNANPAVLLTQRTLLGSLSIDRMAVFCLDTQEPELSRYSSENPINTTTSTNLAYVIYTSGSTGKPKGVGVDQAGIVNRLLWMQDAYTLTSADRVLQKTPFSFDVSVWEFFWPLVTGARLVVAKPGGHQDAAYLSALIQEQGITTLHFVPPMLEVFLNAADVAQSSTLRQVMCSGQALPLELQRQFFNSLPQVALHNLYGPTEASVDVTFWECRKDSTLACVPIGLPIANIQIYLLDQNFNPVPVGVAGELFIAGIGLARGYIGRGDLTAERFIANPFGAPGSRMYRSGDLARYLPDGSIEYLERNDFQVKLRGFRMELGEIEAALITHSGIREAIVIVREDVPNEKRLVAYLVAHDGAELLVVDFRGWLFSILPEYMIPAAYVMLPALPLTLNGKLDRKALPAPEEQSFAKRLYEAPVGETEAGIAAIWQEFLGVAQVGRQDHFFELGGHSLLATQVIGRIQQTFEIDIPLITMFQYPTLSAFSDHVLMLKLSEFSDEDIALLQAEIENLSEENVSSDRPDLTI